jgi:hypothetical protein
MFAFPCLVLAEIDTDLQFKFGSAPGSDRIEIGNTIGHGPDDYGTNVQVEAVFKRHGNSTANFIMGLGFFYRQHDGEIDNLPDPIKVDYAAHGVSIAPGLRLRIDDIWNIEVKIEFGAGKADKMMLDSSGVNWSVLKTDDYISVSPVLGFYYLFENAASRIGFEIGNQEFWGDFEIWTASGSRSPGTVSGRNVTANLVYGIQF